MVCPKCSSLEKNCLRLPNSLVVASNCYADRLVRVNSCPAADVPCGEAGRVRPPVRPPPMGPPFVLICQGNLCQPPPHGLRVGGHTHIFRFAVPYRVLKLAAAAQGVRGNRSKLSAYGFASHNFSRLPKYQNVCGTAARAGSNILCRSKHSKFSGPLPGQIQFFLARGSAIAQASLLVQNL